MRTSGKEEAEMKLQRARGLYDEAARQFELGHQGAQSLFVRAYKEFERAGEQNGMARSALALGRCYLHLRGVTDVREANIWFERALSISADNETRAQALGSLARIEIMSTHDVVLSGAQISPEASEHLKNAERLLLEALNLHAPDERLSRAVTLGALAFVCTGKKDLRNAEGYSRQSIAEYRAAGNVEKAAMGLMNLATIMTNAHRFKDALGVSSEAVQSLRSISVTQQSVNWSNVYNAAIQQRESLRSYLQRTT